MGNVAYQVRPLMAYHVRPLEPDGISDFISKLVRKASGRFDLMKNAVDWPERSQRGCEKGRCQMRVV